MPSRARSSASTRQTAATAARGGEHVAAPALAVVIARRIEEDIVIGRRHPRERLIEQDLCEQFGTHRADVRLALFELERKGIVQRVRNRGAIVRDLTPSEVFEIYAVREELEVMAARILPFPVTARDLRALEELQDQHGRAVASGDLLAVFQANVRFHRALFGLCGNACLIATIEQLSEKVSSIRSSAYADPAALDGARRDHLRMIKALRGGRRDELIALTRDHLKAAPAAYAATYQKRFGAQATG